MQINAACSSWKTFLARIQILESNNAMSAPKHTIFISETWNSLSFTPILHVAEYLSSRSGKMVKALIQWHAYRTNIPKIISQFPYWFILTTNKLTWPINYACRKFRFGFFGFDFIQFRLTLVTADILSNATQMVILLARLIIKVRSITNNYSNWWNICRLCRRNN